MHLRSGNVYTPVDLVRYSKFTILADLNDGGFPEGEWDCALALELFEHIHDVPKLLVQIRSVAARLVCTYCCLEDVGDLTERRERGYFNDFRRADLQSSFRAAGWQVIVSDADERQSIFVCE